MKLKPRILANTILNAVKTFPAVVLTGSRQSGKTTLFQMLFSKGHSFVSLEDSIYESEQKKGIYVRQMENGQ